MPRRAGIWKRGARGFYTTIQGKQVFLGLERDEATRAFHQLKARPDTGDASVRGRQSVAQLVNLYLEHAATEVKKTTLTNYHWYLSKWVAFAGNRPAAGLKPLDVTAWFRTRPRWNPSTRRLATEMVKQWSRWAKAQGYLEADPLQGLKPPKSCARMPARPDDIEKFLSKVTCPLLRDIATVLLDTGARPGEIRTLTADQIDWEASTAVVVGKTGPRVISLTSRSLAILAHLSGRTATGASPDLDSTGPLFRNRDGTPWTKGTLNKRFRTVCKRAGVKVIPYSFRHDLWRRASKAGVDSVVIARQLGHKNLKMLIDRYAHVDTSQTKNAVERAIDSEPVA